MNYQTVSVGTQGIAVGQVQKSASAYVSRKTLGEWVEQKKRNLEFFKKFDLMDDEGILLRGGGLRFGGTALIFRNGQLHQKRGEPLDELWPGWA